MQNDETPKLSTSLTLYLISGFVMGSTLLLSFEDNMLRQDSWLAIIAAFVACAPFVLAIALLAKRFPGCRFIDTLSLIFGPALGNALFLLYAGNFFVLLAFNMRDLADFYIGFITPELPMPIILAVTILVGAYAVRKGIAPIAKVGFASVVYSVVSIVLTTLLLVNKMDFTNFLPILEAPPNVFAQGIHILAAIPYAEVFVFLMILPGMRESGKTARTVFGGLGIAAASFLIITVRNTAVLGPSSLIYAGNTYQAIRLINIGEFLTRVELLSAIGITLVLFTKIIVLYYVTAASVSQLLRMRSQAALVLPLGALAAVVAMIAFESTVEHSYVAARYHAFFSLLFAFIIPPLALLIAALRKLPRKAGEST